jgi:hypothetical protein
VQLVPRQTGCFSGSRQVRPLGYLYKRVAKRPGWLKAAQVDDIFSLSGCISAPFADYIRNWKHNGYWLFDSPAAIERLAISQSISLEGLQLFYYEAHELQYDDKKSVWEPYAADDAFTTSIEVPLRRTLEGFDVTSFSAGTSPECSPLSCNACAERIETNRHCLFETFEQAVLAVESGRFSNCEPGPYRVIGVFTVQD